jgi:prepilin-type N-terminal cleavage/methylation domain-containing protein
MEAMIRRTLSLGPTGHSLESPLSGRPHAVSRHSGFSLIEVMMSLVLMGIGMALALPSYRDMVEKRQVTNGAEQLASFINTVQGVAMKTNQVVTVSYSQTDADDWCVGAVSGATPCDCTVTDSTEAGFCQIASQPFVMNNEHAANRDLVHAVTGDGAYAFDPIRGLFLDLDDSLTMELRSQNQDFRLNVVVNNTGRVSLCSSSSDHAVPGYAICNAPQVEVEPESPIEGTGPIEEPTPLPEVIE